MGQQVLYDSQTVKRLFCNRNEGVVWGPVNVYRVMANLTRRCADHDGDDCWRYINESIMRLSSKINSPKSTHAKLIMSLSRFTSM